MVDPVIILGMHRSGTTVFSKLLEDAGLFMGYNKEYNNESVFFLNLNEWILSQSYSRWDDVSSYFFVDDKFKEYIVEIIKKKIYGISCYKYFGFKRFIIERSINNINYPWGWKDPRNSITYDIWKRIFPNAKFIHIVRNPIDVASSLQARSIKEKKEFRRGIKTRIKEMTLSGNVEYTKSFLVKNIYEGIKLWEQYIDSILKIDEKILNIRYEDLLDKPIDIMEKVLDFINSNELKVNSKTTYTLDKSRKYAFIENKELIKIYYEIKKNPYLRFFNYNKIL